MGKLEDETGRQNGKTHDVVKVNGDCSAEGNPPNRPFTLSCEWDIKQTQQFSDDGTNTYFWRAHSVTVLLIFLCVLVYVMVFEVPSENSEYNVKRGLVACIMVFLLFGVTQIRDGPFKRPHPAFWRLILCLSIVYELALIFLLFQSVDDARQLLKYLDEDLGKPLPEQSYGEDCRLYTPGHPKGSFHTFLEKCDCFLPAHFFGWWAKALILRDYWLLTVISVLFEILEYSLEHQLPNFSECWWDHWVMDVLICNGLGAYLGMKTCDYLGNKPYHWRGLWNISSYSGKFKRMAAQFTPYSWTSYDWRATTSLKRWLAVCGIAAVFLTAELNLFYLKFILWIPPPHFIMCARMGLFLGVGAVALNETYRYMDDPTCKRFGQQAWVCAAIVVTEVLICIKFGWETLSIPLPLHVTVFWSVFLGSLSVWTLWKFWPSIISGFGAHLEHDNKRAANPSLQRPKRE